MRINIRPSRQGNDQEVSQAKMRAFFISIKNIKVDIKYVRKYFLYKEPNSLAEEREKLLFLPIDQNCEIITSLCK